MASRSLEGSFFGAAVILITHDDKLEGTLGVMLNRPLGKRLNEFFNGRWPEDVELFRGGPVQPETLALIGFRFGRRKLEARTHLTPQQAFAFKREAPSQTQLRGYLGYAGWELGQLEDEIDRGDWKVVPLTPVILAPPD